MSIKLIEAAVCPRDTLLQDFEGELLQQGYKPSTVHKKKKLFVDLIDWLWAQELTAGDLSFRLADRFLFDRRSAGYARHKTHKTLRPILDFLHRLKLAPPLEAPVPEGPASFILERYRRFLMLERSLVAATVDRYVDCLRPFLEGRKSADGLTLKLENLTPADVTAFVVARCPQLNNGVAKLTVTALRSFLGFLHLDGITERSLVPAAPKVSRRRLAGLPKGLEPDQVRRLLAACDVDTAVGCRDLAILTLLVRLGLRRGEVAWLRLDDIDWRAGTISVRGKGNCYERVTYLTEAEINALLAAPDRTTWTGRRDTTLFGIAVQTGLRVSELIGLRCSDVHLGAGAHVSCNGKGRKERITPLTSSTVAVIRVWLGERAGLPGDPLFPTRSGRTLSRDALEHRLAGYVEGATAVCPSLACKRVTMHVLRHSAAMRLLQAGIDTSVIALWLGHEQIETTQIYLHADLGIKERALAKTAPIEIKPGRFRPSDKLLAFLEAL